MRGVKYGGKSNAKYLVRFKSGGKKNVGPTARRKQEDSIRAGFFKRR